MKKQYRYIPHVAALFFTLAYFLIYFSQTYYHETFIQDDEYILAPVLKAKTFLDIYRGEFVDIQPIRDLTYWFDRHIQPYFDFNTFKMTNFFLWYFCCITLFIFFKNFSTTYRLKISTLTCLIIAALVLLHPSMSIPVAWISSRKHLLAFLFILWASVFHLKFIVDKSIKSFLFSLLFFALSLYSHVIYSPWCLWASYSLYQFSFFKKTKNYIYPFLICMIAASTSLLNYLFYKNLYPKLNIGKVTGINQSFDLDTFAVPLFAFGRYFFNFINFENINIYYLAYSLENYIGSVLFLTFLILAIKYSRSAEIRSLIVLFFASCFTFTFFILGTFTQNYYVLFLTGITFLTLYLLAIKIKPTFFHNNFVKTCVLLVFIIEITSSSKMALLWKNNINLLKYFKEQEEIPVIRFWYLNETVFSKIRSGDVPSKDFIMDTTELIFHLKKEIPTFFLGARVSPGMQFKAYYGYLHLLVNSPHFNAKLKSEIIDTVCFSNILYCNFYGGVVEYKLGNIEKAASDFNLFLDQVAKILIHESKLDLYFINYNMRNQWASFVSHIVNFHDQKISELTQDKLYELMTVIINNNVNMVLMCLPQANPSEQKETFDKIERSNAPLWKPSISTDSSKQKMSSGI